MDGTLWKWTFPTRHVTPLAAAQSERKSNHSDWIDLAPAMNGVAALAADGTIWFWELEPVQQLSDLGVWPLFKPSRRPNQIGNLFAVRE